MEPDQVFIHWIFLVPQGSCTGPMLYTVYASTLQYQISEGMDLNGFADDHSVNKSFKPNDRDEELRTIELLESSLRNINSWMNLNRLQMNTSKTEFMMIGSGKQLTKCVTNNITVCNDIVEKVELLDYWAYGLSAILISRPMSLKRVKLLC